MKEEDWEEGEKEVKEEEREGRLRRVDRWICRWIGESRGRVDETDGWMRQTNGLLECVNKCMGRCKILGFSIPTLTLKQWHRDLVYLLTSFLHCGWQGSHQPNPAAYHPATCPLSAS